MLRGLYGASFVCARAATCSLRRRTGAGRQEDEKGMGRAAVACESWRYRREGRRWPGGVDHLALLWHSFAMALLLVPNGFPVGSLAAVNSAMQGIRRRAGTRRRSANL